MTGSAGQRRVPSSFLSELQIPLLPITEQWRIAAILDQADELRQNRKASIKMMGDLPQAVFSEMFGAPPESWPELRLEQVVRSGTIVTYGIVQAGDEFPGGVPYIRTGDIVNGEIISSGLRQTDPAIAARFQRSRVDAGDIVMSIRATVGTTALVPPSLAGANLTQGTARIAPGERTDRLFLLNWLRTQATQQWIQRQVKGATFREITLNRLRDLPVRLPPLPLQQRFSNRVKEVERLRTSASLHLSRLNSLFASLQHRTFRGDLTAKAVEREFAEVS
jgi:type I restriction enzyme S subunit